MRSVAIVGSGPSGVYTLARLIQSTIPMHVTLFERGQRPGVGTPYDPQTTPVDLLANIASVEIPPICERFIEFLDRQDDGFLKVLGVDRAELNERSFYPRIALGAYFADQLSQLAVAGAAAGHVVEVLAEHQVRDVVPDDDAVAVVFERKCGRIASLRFDSVVLATGHVIPTPKAASSDAIVSPQVDVIGVLGSSLSGIDAAVSIACARGRFEDGGYVLGDGAKTFHVTLMSRGGRLPGADFYCPLPADPADGFRQDEVKALARAAQPGTRLDAVFGRFAEILKTLDTDYARHLGLDGLTADTFADAYFRDRDRSDPIDWARRDLATSLDDASSRTVVAWKYAILRMHEPFAACLVLLDDAERKRFMNGLKQVFIDNYAAVPPRSIQRLLALYDAGHLSVRALGGDYALSPIAGGGGIVAVGAEILEFERVIDARGQTSAPDAAFPFPTLRFLLSANRGPGNKESAIVVDDDYHLQGGLNPLRHIFCLSLPFLLARQPFVQGLTSAAMMGGLVADAILRTDARESREGSALVMDDLADIVARTSPVLMANGNVLLAAK